MENLKTESIVKDSLNFDLEAFIGSNFMKWANSYLSYGSADTLDVYFHYMKFFKMYCIEHPHLDVSYKWFRLRLISYCELKGWIYNPIYVKYLAKDNRICLKVDFEPIFDDENMCWELKPLDKKRTTEFF